MKTKAKSKTTPGAVPAQKAPDSKAPVSTASWFILVACVFLFRTYAWTTSELWYDETLNLQRFILPHLYEDGLGGVFTDYPIANNHILATAMHVAWLQLVGEGFNEFILRFPDILCGLGTIALVMFHWKKYLGYASSALAGLLLAISPIFTAYAYQLRGYSLTMLLATLAISGILDATHQNKLRGQCLLCLSGLLLPLVMPSNLMLAPVIPIVGIALMKEEETPWKQSILAQLPWCAATLLGAAYYLTIWEQFRGAMAEPNGWNSALAVVGNLLLALFAHVGALALPAIVTATKRKLPWKTVQNRTLLITLLATVASILCTFIAAQSGHYPFPRVYLIFLPLATFFTMRWSKELAQVLAPSATMLAVTALVAGILVERCSEGMTDYQLKQGYVPDNLLQQYYRGATDLREISTNRQLNLQNALLLTDAYDEMTLSMYMTLIQKQQKDVKPTLVMGAHRLADKSLPDHLPRVLVLAHNKDAAMDMLMKTGISQPCVQQLYQTTSKRRGIFQLSSRK